MFGEEYDLANMAGVMRMLAIDGLHDGMRRGANINRALHIRRRPSVSER